MALVISSGAAVIDANVLIAVCGREKEKLNPAETAINDYAAKGWFLYAPGVIVGEVLYILCGKLQSGVLTPAEHALAVQDLHDQMSVILPPPNGDSALVLRAEEMRRGYGCSRSADGLYLALAEELSQSTTTELLTFDRGS